MKIPKKITKLLQKINNIPMECSDIEDDEMYDSEGELLDIQNGPYGRDDVLLDNNNSDNVCEVYTDESTDTDKENDVNILNVRKRKRNLQLSTSEEESEEDTQREIATDGTIWEKLHVNASGRNPIHCIFKDEAGPTGYAKRYIMKGIVSSAFSLIINDPILELHLLFLIHLC